MREEKKGRLLTRQLPYDYDAYWPTFIQTCLERRREQEERWRALGEPRVGREERLYKTAPPRTAVNGA
jgi:hypothetical protein